MGFCNKKKRNKIPVTGTRPVTENPPLLRTWRRPKPQAKPPEVNPLTFEWQFVIAEKFPLLIDAYWHRTAFEQLENEESRFTGCLLLRFALVSSRLFHPAARRSKLFTSEPTRSSIRRLLWSALIEECVYWRMRLLRGSLSLQNEYAISKREYIDIQFWKIKTEVVCSSRENCAERIVGRESSGENCEHCDFLVWFDFSGDSLKPSARKWERWKVKNKIQKY